MLFYSKYKSSKHEKKLVRININGNLHFRSQTQVANTGCNYVIYYKC